MSFFIHFFLPIKVYFILALLDKKFIFENILMLNDILRKVENPTIYCGKSC